MYITIYVKSGIFDNLGQALYNVPTLVLIAVDKVRSGSFKGGVFNLGMKDGVVDIAAYHDFDPKIAKKAKDMIADSRKKITAGSLKIPVVTVATK
ncbi:MAG: hypothetical protein WCQ50_12095 [Spirochaetota bacterium]